MIVEGILTIIIGLVLVSWSHDFEQSTFKHKFLIAHSLICWMVACIFFVI
jgi:hypothetical protein